VDCPVSSMIPQPHKPTSGGSIRWIRRGASTARKVVFSRHTDNTQAPSVWAVSIGHYSWISICCFDEPKDVNMCRWIQPEQRRDDTAAGGAPPINAGFTFSTWVEHTCLPH
jgi:hypothetical protein